MIEGRLERIKRLSAVLHNLTNDQLSLIERVVYQFLQPFTLIESLSSSDIINNCLLTTFGDVLRIHHCFSKEPLSKDRFEYALERSANVCGLTANLAPKGNPGHDITINNIKISLKTEASTGIKHNRIHISKYMELGKGEWLLPQLRERYLHHLNSYERIFTLRCLSKKAERWHYQLVEIPKDLLLDARTGVLRIDLNSRQNPQPGYCDVTDSSGNMVFQLYFDAGTERKLQIRNIDINYCMVHANWIFSTQILLDDQPPLDT